MDTKSLVLAGSAFLLGPVAAHGQTASQPAPEQQPPQDQASAAAAQDYQDEEDSQTIIVTGRRLPGSVIGDIPPENVLSSGDVRATGATNINDLLDAIAPEVGSSRFA